MWLLFTLACAPDDPGAGLPADGFVVATPDSVTTFARCLARFPESEASALGEAWARSAATCSSTLYAEGTSPQLECGPPPPALAAALAGHQFRFGLPRTAAGVVSGAADSVGSGEISGSLLIPLPETPGALNLLIPAGGSSGPAALTNQNAFLHVRGRPESGIDIAALVPADSQADQLFDMKSSLLSAAVLQGTWELAAYPPAAGKSMPEVVLGLGVRSATAPTALDTFTDALRKKWSVHPEPIERDAWKGACMRGLNVMPEFEPCYLLNGEMLAIGFNEAAVRTGTADGVRESFPTGLGAIIDTAALTASDAALSSLFTSELQFPPLAYPAGRIRLDAHTESGYLVVAVDAPGCQ